MPGNKIERKNIFSTEGKETMPAEKPLEYTGVRVEKYATIRAAGLAPDVRRDAIHKLNIQERRALKAKAKNDERRAQLEAARQEALAIIERAKEAQRERRREEVRIARNARRRAARRAAAATRRYRIDRILLDATHINGWVMPEDRDDPIVDGDWRTLYARILAVAERLVGVRRAYMHITVDGEIISQELFVPIGRDADAVWFNNIRPFIHEGGTDTSYNLLTKPNADNEYDNQLVRFVIMESDAIPIGRVLQRYLDGVDHCVLEPLTMLWRTMGENSESIGSQKRCFQIARRLDRLRRTTYPNGVPEGRDMEAVARVAHRCLVLHDILGNEIKRYNDKSNKCFHFTNTRINHLEKGYLTLDKNYERVSMKEMAKILAEHDKDGIFYLFSGDVRSKSAQTLRSARGCWAVFNEDYDLFQEFNEQTGVNKYGIDAVKHSSLNAFLMESRVINSAPTPLCDEPNNLEGVDHIDVEKAYTQHHFAGLVAIFDLGGGRVPGTR
jgi:hypothetical protein